MTESANVKNPHQDGRDWVEGREEPCPTCHSLYDNGLLLVRLDAEQGRVKCLRCSFVNQEATAEVVRYLVGENELRGRGIAAYQEMCQKIADTVLDEVRTALAVPEGESLTAAARRIFDENRNLAEEKTGLHAELEAARKEIAALKEPHAEPVKKSVRKGPKAEGQDSKGPG